MLRPLLLPILGLAAAFGARAELAADEPSYFRVPAFYEQVKDRLTPLEDVKPGVARFADSVKPAINLLLERVEHVGDDDVRHTVFHGIYYVKDKAAIAEAAKNVFSFRKSGEEIFLVEAKTIQPDGRETPVARNAVFIQSPQTEAQANLYTDTDQLVVIYPDVAVGSMLEYVVILREHTPIVPSQFARSYYFQRGWPTYKLRYELDMPREMAARARFSRTGAGVPERVESSAGDRVVWTYHLGPRDGLPFEVNREPLEDTGPLERVSTFASWDEIGDWFRGLVAGRDELGEDLQAAVYAWTEGLETRDEIIAAVFDRVANDVRYTGLEFGIAGYQPYDCNLVWNNKYGDCKDKANLLVAALARKGIRAHIALIDTTGLGKFDPASPNPFYFNHAIAAVAQEDGSWLFLDPTIENLRVGDLPTGDVNRLAAIIADDRVELARTPDTPLGAARYQLDLALDESLTLSGWLSLSGERYYRSWFHDYYEDLSPEALREDMRGLVQSLFPGAATHDASFDAASRENEPLTRAYFTLPHEGQGDDGSYVLRAPKLDWFIDNTGDSSERTTDYQIRRAEQQLAMRVDLPPGMRPATLPRAFDVSTPQYQFHAEWRERDGQLSAEVRVSRRADRIVAADFPAYREASRALERWWTTPVFISVGQRSERATASTAFPKLSSARGQLALATELYGEDDDPAEMLAALRKVIEWFPEDRAVVYEAKMESIRRDMTRLDPRVAIQRIRALLVEHEKDVDPSYFAWGEFLLAQSLESAGEADEALDLYSSHLGRDDLVPFRVGWAGYNAARLLAERDPKRVPETVWLGLEDESEATPALIYQLVSSRLKDLDKKRLRADIAELRRRFPATFEAAMRAASEELEVAYVLSSPKSVALWREVVEEQIKDFPGLESLRPGIVRLETQTELRRAFPKFSKALAATLREDPPSWLLGSFAAKLSANELYDRIEKSKTTSDWRAVTSYSLYLVANHPAEIARASEALAWIAWALDEQVEASRGLDAFLDQKLESLPPANDDLFDARINWATKLRDSGRPRRAIEVLRKLLGYKGLHPSYRGITHARLGQAYEAAGERELALEEYFSGARFHFANARIYYGVLRAYFLALSLDDFDAARRAIDLFAEANKDGLAAESYADQAGKIVALRTSAEFAQRYWNTAKEARAEVRRLLPALGAPEAQPLPVIVDYAAVLEALKGSRSDRSQFYDLYLFLLDSAFALPSDLPLAIDQLMASGYQDGATQALARALSPLVDLAIEAGPYALRSELQRDRPRLLAFRGDARAAAAAARQILADSAASAQSKDAAAALWAGLVAADRIDDPGALDALLERIRTSDMSSNRPGSVLIATRLLMSADRRGEARALVERELGDRRVSSDVQFKPELEKLRQELAKGEAATSAFVEAARSWLEKAGIRWWDHIEPLSKEQLYQDGKLLDYEDAVQVEALATRAKYELLVALDSDEPLDRREDALHAGLRAWADMEADPSRLQALLSQLFDDERLDRVLRNRIRIIAFYEACENRDAATARSVFGDGEFFADRYRQSSERLLRYLEQPKDTPESLAAAVRFLLEEPLSWSDAQQLADDFAAAGLRFEDGSEAEAALLEIGKASIEPGERLTAAQAQMSCLQPWRTGRALRPVATLLLEICRESFTSPAKPGRRYQPGLMDREEFESVALWQLETGYGYRELFSIMREALHYTRNTTRTLSAARVDQLFAAFEASIDSNFAGEFARALQNAVDIDEEDEALRYFKALEAYLDKHDDEGVANMYNYYRFAHEARYGDAEELRRLGFLSSKGDKGDAVGYRLLQLWLAGDIEEGRARFETLDPDFVTEPRFQFEMHAVASELGDRLMERLIATRIHEEARDGVTRAISSGRVHPFAVIDYALRFPEEAKSLSWYAEYMVEATREPFAAAIARALSALLRDDWQAVVDECRAADAVASSYWDLQLPLGLGLTRLGRDAEAAEALDIYLRYRPTRALAGVARELKREIEARSVASAAEGPAAL